MVHNRKIWISIIGLIVIALVIFLFNVLVVNRSIPENPATNAVISEDPLQVLRDSNLPFKEGIERVRRGEYQAAIESLNQARQLAQSPTDRSMIDFVIGDTTFELNRTEGIRLLSVTAKTTEYSERTRALAMLRAFLMYFKYSDEDLLRQLAVEHEILWTIPEEVSYQYMKKLDALYPFAFARIWMIGYELNTIKEGIVAKQLYEQSRSGIESNIEDLKKWSGEVVELTSTMSANARLLSRLALEYDAVSSEDVSTAFETLIDYDDARDLIVNKQYALVHYADFLSGAGEFEKAAQMIRMVTDEGPRPALIEGLPKFDRSVLLPNLELLLKNSTDQVVIDFITSIGSDTN